MFIYQLICFKVITLGLLLVVSWEQLPCRLSLQLPFGVCGRRNTQMKQRVSISQMNPVMAPISCFFLLLLFLGLLSPFSYFFQEIPTFFLFVRV